MCKLTIPISKYPHSSVCSLLSCKSISFQCLFLQGFREVVHNGCSAVYYCQGVCDYNCLVSIYHHVYAQFMYDSLISSSHSSITQILGVYEEGKFKLDRSYMYLSIVNGISQLVSDYMYTSVIVG